MDASLITTAFSSIKFVKDSFTAILDLKIENEAQVKIHDALKQLGEVHENLFALRDQLFELQSKNKELQAELDNQNKWAEFFSAYELTHTAGGAVVYGFKGNPPHYACPSCMSNKQVHILQDRKVMSGEFILT